MNRLSIYILLIIILSSCQTEDIPKAKPIEYDVKQDLLTKINALRTSGCKCGEDSMPPVNALVWHTILESSSKNHALDMINRNYFDHISPEGFSAINRAQAIGYTGSEIGEIIAKGYNNIDAVMIGWQNSPEHCKAMMDSRYNEMGGVKINSYWVVNFGVK